MDHHTLSPAPITIDELQNIRDQRCTVELSGESVSRIEHCRQYLDNKLSGQNVPIYGINTGFGALHSTSISEENLEQLQINLVRSHACGMGDEVPAPIVRLMLYLKARGLSYGHSGAQTATVKGLIALLNNNALPVIYQQGSLGASGDLAPLAHLTLALLGEGEVNWKGKRSNADEVLSACDMQPITLKSKEGLALLNGTQFMSSYASHLVLESRRLIRLADEIAALSLEAFDGRIEPFGPQVHAIRNHQGQQQVAKHFRSILEGSELINRPKKHVQDPYCFRCIPQVHGATRDALEYIASVVEREINAVTDNPTIFPDDDMVVSAGNFHGQPLALALDHMALIMAEIGSISERRTYKLISGNRGLPAFLVANPGLNSGFMIPQYTAASIVSQNKGLCFPASVDTIDSSNGQEDHVSMGANAATKAFRVVENVKTVLAIELMNAAQAFEFRRPAKTSAHLEQLLQNYRKEVPFMESDTYIKPMMDSSREFVEAYANRVGR
ncbi:MAG: histidine ammonia-lyase [Flavobacteriales bacterium]|nr:histidine ammonia-lyase [Flavobacteriales bacterium]